ncbi:MAG TPA: FAD-dependent oxidoreductase [Gemmatimonadaceae bacterium]|jgi:NADH dehydrogenase
MTAPVRVLCLGGGYVATQLSRTLRRAVRRGEIELTVVSRENFQTFHGFVNEMLTGKLQPGQIINPARHIFPPARFLNAEITGIDTERRRVTTTRLLDGREYALDYDHLVIALGSADDLSRYPGIAQHTLRLKTYWDCFKARNHLVHMLEMAELETDPEERRRLLTFVVAGGNFGGIEVATELADWLQSIIGTHREYRHIDARDARVIVVHGGERILPEMGRHHPRLVEYAERVLTATPGLEIRCGTHVAAATPDEVVLRSGERIPTRTTISCTGTAMPPVLADLPFARDDRGRIITDEYLRVTGADRVWAAGDCAAVPHPRGGTCPPLFAYALSGGRQIARNILRSRGSKPLARYRFTGLGDACSLGRRRAVATLAGVPTTFTGLPAWLGWRALGLSFVPTWDRRVRIALDWLLWPLFGRDVVGLRIDEPFGMRREYYEVGQSIVREGETGTRLYFILAGEVDVVRATSDGEQHLAILTSGQHFGERAVLGNVRRTATVRARTPLEVVVLGRDEALTLGGTVAAFGDSIRALPTPVEGDRQRLS